MSERQASFRDPGGRLLHRGDRVLRVVLPAGAPEARGFLDSPLARTLVERGEMVGTRILDPAEAEALAGGPELRGAIPGGGAALLLEHERIPFPSFAYEWPPEMLHAAGSLTLDLAERALRDGFGLKDATPYNVLFRGPRPVFVDVLSFERRQPGDPIWLPYAQFQRTFLRPLLANRYFGVPLDQTLLARRDGLEPDDLYRLASPLRRIAPPFLGLVSLPRWLNPRAAQASDRVYRPKPLADPDKACFILESLLRGARGHLDRLAPEARRSSAWAGYMEERPSYQDADFRAKEAFVDTALREVRPRSVLDVGCNTGHFSAMAARAGARVVAIDGDPAVVGEAWRTAGKGCLDILPLVVNLAQPTPATGWRNGENPSFLERARGSFDCLLMLAVIHHLTVTDRIPLDAVVDLASELTTDAVVAEFVSPEDPMFRRLVRGRDDLYRHLTREAFEAAWERWFRVSRTLSIAGGNRCLYLLRRIPSTDMPVVPDGSLG